MPGEKRAEVGGPAFLAPEKRANSWGGERGREREGEGNKERVKRRRAHARGNIRQGFFFLLSAAIFNEPATSGGGGGLDASGAVRRVPSACYNGLAVPLAGSSRRYSKGRGRLSVGQARVEERKTENGEAGSSGA